MNIGKITCDLDKNALHGMSFSLTLRAQGHSYEIRHSHPGSLLHLAYMAENYASAADHLRWGKLDHQLHPDHYLRQIQEQIWHHRHHFPVVLKIDQVEIEVPKDPYLFVVPPKVQRPEPLIPGPLDPLEREAGQDQGGRVTGRMRPADLALSHSGGDASAAHWPVAHRPRPYRLPKSGGQ